MPRNSITGEFRLSAAESNYNWVPTVTAAPTAVPPVLTNGAAMVYDTTNKKIWVYDVATSTWKGVVVA